MLAEKERYELLILEGSIKGDLPGFLDFFSAKFIIFYIIFMNHFRDAQNLDVVMFLKLRSLILTSNDLTRESLFKILD